MIAGLGERLGSLRFLKNLTQKQVAEIIGLGSAAVSSYENSTATPPAEVLIKLAKLYNVSVDYLLGLDDEPRISVKGLGQEQVETVQKLIDMLRVEP